MGKKTITFVIGAGASKSAGFPLGKELVDQILSILLMHEDFAISPQLIRQPVSFVDRGFQNATIPLQQEFPAESLNLAARRLKASLGQGESIDRVLHVNRENEIMVRLGKLAITYLILNSENQSSLKIPEGNKYNKLDFLAPGIEWLNRLWQMLFFKFNADQLVEQVENYKFIVFNYDRCVEHFLYESFKNCYPDSIDRADEFISKIEFIHPYGKIGTLPFSGRSVSMEKIVGFGENVHSSSYDVLAKGIRLFTEGLRADENLHGQIHRVISSSERLIFLGFGFMDTNIDLLQPREIAFNKSPKHIFATAFGESEFNASWVEKRLSRFMHDSYRTQITVDNTADCLKLLNDYSNGIAN